MSASVVVAYASQYGSTQEVTEAVAEVLRAQGLEVDVQPARAVRSLAAYDAVVLGAPLYIGHWLKDAHRFLEQHQDALAQRPVAVFALGPTLTGDEEEWQGARQTLDQELARYPWLKPVALAMFGGRYDPARLSLPHKLLAALPASPLHGVSANDLRDWEAIDAWASEVAAQLQTALAA